VTTVEFLNRFGLNTLQDLPGLTSHTCVESAGRHALDEGFHVTFLTDPVAEFTEEAHKAAISCHIRPLAMKW
jgi:nicotinamidase-related amidase